MRTIKIELKKPDSVFLHNAIFAALRREELDTNEKSVLLDLVNSLYMAVRKDDWEELGPCRYEQWCSLPSGHAGRCE